MNPSPSNASLGTRFPNAGHYLEISREGRFLMREPRPGFPAFSYTERHVQAVWHDPAWRPESLRTADGQRVDVDFPGEWNLEAGPDFLGARLRVQPGNRHLHGDVEIHISPRDWKAHGHQKDPRYRDVCLHVTFFPGELEPGLLPPGTLQVSLQEGLAADPRFSFEQIDVTEYPSGIRADTPPCYEVLRSWEPERRRRLLVAAGEARLRHKAERMTEQMKSAPRPHVLYRHVLTALGYKHNKAPARALADRLPFDEWQEAAGQDPCRAYALLLGVAGLMPTDPSPHWHPDARAFVRDLWAYWWPLQETWGSRALPRTAWRLAHVRPANHPVRRLMAAARLFVPLASSPLQALLEGRTPTGPAGAKSLLEQMTSIADPFWSHRLSWSRPPEEKPVALLGRQRAGGLFINVLLPFLAATGQETESLLRWLETRSDLEPCSRTVKRAAGYLFGPDHAPSQYRDALRRQGLLQIYEDFCLIDRTRCHACPFPGWLRSTTVDGGPV